MIEAASDCAKAAVYGPQLPTRKDLDAATAASAYALADPDCSRQVRQRLLEAEEAAFLAYLHRPGAAAELEAGI